MTWYLFVYSILRSLWGHCKILYSDFLDYFRSKHYWFLFVQFCCFYFAVQKMKMVFNHQALVVVLVGLLSSSIQCHPHNKQQSLRKDPPVINTKYGPVKGTSSDICNMYLGKQVFQENTFRPKTYGSLSCPCFSLTKNRLWFFNFSNSHPGIPFAEPPLNERRWEKPVDASPWYPNTLDATQMKPACPQTGCASRMPNDSCPIIVWWNV